jgi:hypothetical protein
VAKFGLEEADKVLPGYDVRALELGAQEEINARRDAAASPAPGGTRLSAIAERYLASAAPDADDGDAPF